MSPTLLLTSAQMESHVLYPIMLVILHRSNGQPCTLSIMLVILLENSIPVSSSTLETIKIAARLDLLCIQLKHTVPS